MSEENVPNHNFNVLVGAVMVSMVEDNEGIPMGIWRVDILPDGAMLRLVPKFENERVF